MKIKKYLLFLCMCLTTIIPSIQGIPAKKKEPIAYVNEELEIENALYNPVKFSASGVRFYLKHAYNRPEYIQDILPSNLSHFIQFLQHGKKTKQTRAYLKSVFKLFNNKVKAAPYLNAYTFSTMLEQLPELLGDHFVIARLDSLDKYKESINDILYSNFLAKYDVFKKKTHEFFDGLSQEIINVLQSDISLLEESVSVVELRQTMIRFLEIGSGKLVWSPDEPDAIWDSVKKISTQLEALMDINIINDSNDLDDLYWSLIHRFCFFLDVAGNQLPLSFYDKVKNDIATQQLLLLELEEQEPVLEPKAKWLMRAIVQAQAKREGTEKGIIT
jgi:hypothetical protein